MSETIPNGKVIAVLRHLIMMAYKGSGDISPPILNVNSNYMEIGGNLQALALRYL